MASRLTDAKKKCIIADYTELGSYNAVAKKHKIARETVRRTIENNPDVAEIANEKREQNTQDMLSYMDSRKEIAQEAIDLYLEALTNPNKINAATLPQIATAFGIVIDKFTKLTAAEGDSLQKLDGLLKEFKDAVKPETD